MRLTSGAFVPTANPRITVTLTPQLHALLRELASLSGRSQSAWVAEFLETAQPVLERTATLFAAAARLKAEGVQAGTEFRDSLAAAETRMSEQLGLALDVMDGASRPLLDQAEKLTRRRGRAKASGARSSEAAPAVLTPVPVTRGSGTPTKRKAAAKGRTERGVSNG